MSAEPRLEDLEIEPAEVHRAREAGEEHILIDCREHDELKIASIEGAVHIPMGDFKTRFHEVEADEDTPISIFCHSGRRSLMVTLALREDGFENARSVRGGIDLWSQTIDPTIPRY